MTPRPPKLAMWLLRRSGVAQQNAPLAGDLIEEFQQGRSDAWFWRQTIVAIAANLIQDARSLGSYGMAIIVGWGIQACITITLCNFQEPSMLAGRAWWTWSLLIALSINLFPNEISRDRYEQVSREYRATMWVLLAVRRCVNYVMVYCLFALIFRISLDLLIVVQIGWLYGEWWSARKLRTNRSPSL